MALAPVIGLYPPPHTPPPGSFPARHLSTLTWAHDAPWFGGLSGLEISQDGSRIAAVTDRGHILRADLKRSGDKLAGVEITDVRGLVDRFGTTRPFPFTDAEGLAGDPSGALAVSFEHAHRILVYETPEAPARWPSYTPAWRALHKNGGLETLAINAQGTLFAIPEHVAPGAFEALVYTHRPRSKWQQSFTLPLTYRFVPVGGDFGPDGRFYLLEREFRYLGFRSQVRVMDMDEDGIENIATLLQTPWRRHDNLEGLAVWRDEDGRIRLTMVSDDNFAVFLRSELVEYIVTE